MLDVLLEREVGLAEDEAAVQALVELLVPVLKQRDDLLGARVVGAVRARSRSAGNATGAGRSAARRSSAAARSSTASSASATTRATSVTVSSERLLERGERGVRVALAVTVGRELAQAARRTASGRARPPMSAPSGPTSHHRIGGRGAGDGGREGG